jgi:hypothetical protein
MYGCQNWHHAMICWGFGGFGVGLTRDDQVFPHASKVKLTAALLGTLAQQLVEAYMCTARCVQRRRR